MKLEHQIEIDSYRFLLTLESKTIQAHSLMSDNKDILNKSLHGHLDDMKGYPLKILIKEHERKMK